MVNQSKIITWIILLLLISSSFIIVLPSQAAETANTTGGIDYEANVPIGDFDKCTFVAGSASNCLGEYLRAWYGFMVGTVGILATIMIMYAGFKYLTSRGENKEISNAKEIIIAAISGIAIALLSYTILNIVNPNLLNLRMPSLESFETENWADTGDYNVPENTVRPYSTGGTASLDLNSWDPQNRSAIEQISQLEGVNDVTTYANHDNATNRQGMAADIWCENNDCDQVAQELAANYQNLGISYIIWDQSIWNPYPHGQSDRQNNPQYPSGDPTDLDVNNWDTMNNRGSVTANHRDHIHISFR